MSSKTVAPGLKVKKRKTNKTKNPTPSHPSEFHMHSEGDIVCAKLWAGALIIHTLLAVSTEKSINFELHHPCSESELPRRRYWRGLWKAAGV